MRQTRARVRHTIATDDFHRTADRSKWQVTHGPRSPHWPVIGGNLIDAQWQLDIHAPAMERSSAVISQYGRREPERDNKKVSNEGMSGVR